MLCPSCRFRTFTLPAARGNVPVENGASCEVTANVMLGTNIYPIGALINGPPIPTIYGGDPMGQHDAIRLRPTCTTTGSCKSCRMTMECCWTPSRFCKRRSRILPIIICPRNRWINLSAKRSAGRLAVGSFGQPRRSHQSTAPTLVSWQLNLVLADKVPAAIPVSDALTQTNYRAAEQHRLFLRGERAAVGQFRHEHSHVTSNGNAPLNLLFNQTILPTGTNITDIHVVDQRHCHAEHSTLSICCSPLPPLEPGQRYYLGVQNKSPNPVPFTLEVDFDITTLTNAIPVTSAITNGNVPRYFQFDVDTNAVADVLPDREQPPARLSWWFERRAAARHGEF